MRRQHINYSKSNNNNCIAVLRRRRVYVGISWSSLTAAADATTFTWSPTFTMRTVRADVLNKSPNAETTRRKENETKQINKPGARTTRAIVSVHSTFTATITHAHAQALVALKCLEFFATAILSSACCFYYYLTIRFLHGPIW